MAFLRKHILPILLLLVTSVTVHAQAGGNPVTSSSASKPSETFADGFPNRKYLLGDFDGKRTSLEDKGVVLSAFYTGEVFANPFGGVDQGAIYEGLLELDLTLDLKKIAGWNGAFHACSYYPMGSSMTNIYTHDLMVISNIDAYDTFHLFELWYEHKFLDDKIALRIGQMGANNEFVISNGGAKFLAGTYGWPAFLASNAPTPNYAYGAPGVRLRVDPNPSWTFQGAIYAGNPAPDRLGDPNPHRRPDSQFNNSGTEFYMNASQGVFGIFELWFNGDKERADAQSSGTYKLGGWFHTDTFSSKRYDDQGRPLASPASDGTPLALDGNLGVYGVADQAIWRSCGESGKGNSGKGDKPDQVREIDLFARTAIALDDRSLLNFYCDGGITFNGFVPGRPADFFGIATAYGSISSSVEGYTEDFNRYNGTHRPVPDFECNIELTYFAQIAPCCTLQPDVQIVVHPGGSSAIDNALVVGCRMVLSF